MKTTSASSLRSCYRTPLRSGNSRSNPGRPAACVVQNIANATACRRAPLTSGLQNCAQTAIGARKNRHNLHKSTVLGLTVVRPDVKNIVECPDRKEEAECRVFSSGNGTYTKA